MRSVSISALAVLYLITPSQASELSTSTASSSYNPWVAAGLTYAPGAAAFATGTMMQGLGNPAGLETGAVFLLANPFPGRGHDYVQESRRGLAFFGISCTLLAAAGAANVAIYYKNNEMGYAPLQSRSRPMDSLRDNINIGYLVTSAALSAWAAWDAYRIAEEKNCGQQPTDLVSQ